MDTGTEAQRAALKLLWPEIGSYCERHALPAFRLLSGKDGIPIDGRKMALLRGNLLIDRKEFARQAGVSLDTISKIENGARSPSPAMLAAIVKVLGCPATELLRDDGKR